MTFSANDLRYMRRALQLAASGRGHVSPNPMVGAVIVAPDGRMIGEGWHRRFGGPHAEVNAVHSVAEADRALMPESTIYVTLEPCSHYGKTPPCALLLRETGFRRVVVGAGDPNPKVAGRGIAMLREAGIQVDEGCLEKECCELNIKFMTAHRLRRPYITLKWACSADGYMDACRHDGGKAYRFSDARGTQIVHSLRAVHDAIAVGASTALLDNPGLDTRFFDGASPRPVLFDRHCLVAEDSCRIASDPRLLRIDGGKPLEETLHEMYAADGITSLLVEGGASLLRSFISAGLWDEARVEVNPVVLGDKGRAEAPALPCQPVGMTATTRTRIFMYTNQNSTPRRRTGLAS
ncbi:MAG: bifunctional diaminohydroxyphosphoribosylaminopyrimidine deaminase/5-amino-6-(5-phosphoribosylamino)uracil reductase RibD [Muribaculaceae bacterium]|nr:bifunctional diaminohydroxyphosphoribosylaminopyrimidine deaminase/5-amino-6-(5-phosphoribosylamino)uracil reductase RibD [Muribaculaceae bacterium]